jgi:hypothetical protein
MNFLERCDEILSEKADSLNNYRKLSNSILSYIDNEFNVNSGEISFVDDDGNQAEVDIDLSKPVFEYDEVYQEGIQTFLESVGFAISFNPDWETPDLKKFSKQFDKIKEPFFDGWSIEDKPGVIAYAKSLKWSSDFKDMGDIDKFAEKAFHNDI